MAFARTIAVFTITVSFVTFVAFFGRLPTFRNTPIGFLHRLLVIHIPSSLRRLDILVTNGRITNGSSRLGHYLMYEKHPVVLIFFLGLVTASAVLFVPEVWPHLPLLHKLLVLCILPLPHAFTYLSARRNDETYINAKNHDAQMKHYPFDRVLFNPGMVCATCDLLKPPRSKHCSICKTCVARADHHCIWVNNCLGRGNYRWFLYLLLSTAIMLAYGAYLAHMVLSPMVHKEYKEHERWYRYDQGPTADPLSWLVYFDMKLHYFLVYAGIYLEAGGLAAAGVGLLALMTWPLPLGLLGYHVYLIWAGMTTNESSKWADWRDDMADGVVFLGTRREDSLRSSHPHPKQHDSNGSSTSTAPMLRFPPEDEEPPTTWPIESRHILVRTRDGEPPENLPIRIAAFANKDSFKRVWNLSEVENVYDLGFWDNLVEVL
ncbi:palmitoyltransferase swf1, partial [Polyplosphaeria fusca]